MQDFVHQPYEPFKQTTAQIIQSSSAGDQALLVGGGMSAHPGDFAGKPSDAVPTPFTCPSRYIVG